jgi:hypothetical protein
MSRRIDRDVANDKVRGSLPVRNNKAREGEASFVGFVLPVDVIATLRDDQSGLVQRGEGHRGEYGAGGDQGEKLSHVLAPRRVLASMKRTYCAAYPVAVTEGTP